MAAKALFHDALVVLAGASSRYDVTVCRKLAPNRYQIRENLYERNGNPAAVNPDAPKIERVYTRYDAVLAGFISNDMTYGGGHDTSKSIWADNPPVRGPAGRVHGGKVA
jgi:hypothetical protein